MDVAVWLRSLSLERYEAAFRENEIDESVLQSLTRETLYGWFTEGSDTLDLKKRETRLTNHLKP